MSKIQRYANLAAVILPFAAFAAAIVLLWNSLVGWTDLAILAVMYVSTALGVTIGYHRLLTHRAFDAPRPVRYALAGIGLLLPFGLGYALTGTLAGALTGLLWGGFVRVFLVHHVTWSINSVCHFFGRRRFDTDDYSTNVAWLALPSFGEAWHHNHHAFPRSAEHGLTRWERLMDPSAWVIRGLERLHLASGVVR